MAQFLSVMQNVTKVEKVDSTEAANKMLARGWVLVTTHTRLFGDGSDTKEGDEYVCFIVGWPKPLPADYPADFKHIKGGTDT